MKQYFAALALTLIAGANLAAFLYGSNKAMGIINLTIAIFLFMQSHHLLRTPKD